MERCNDKLNGAKSRLQDDAALALSEVAVGGIARVALSISLVTMSCSALEKSGSERRP